MGSLRKSECFFFLSLTKQISFISTIRSVVNKLLWLSDLSLNSLYLLNCTELTVRISFLKP